MTSAHDPDGEGAVTARSRRQLLTGAAAAAGALVLSPFAAAKVTAAAPPTDVPALAPAARRPARALARATATVPRVATFPASQVRYGVNYTPSKNWWFAWEHWDRLSVDRDLRQIADLGVDHIRIQLPWSVFQSTPYVVAKAPLDHLEEMLDLAGARDLDVTVSVLTGHLSGITFLPRWAGNFITNPATVAAEELYFRAVGARIGHHRALMGFDLGNEILGGASPATQHQLFVWAQRLLHVCKLVAPGRLHSISPRGEDTVPYPELVASLGPVSVIHPWVFAANSAKRGRLNLLAINQATYNAELVKSFHNYSRGGSDRQVWVQEFGAPEVNFSHQRVLPPALHAEFLTKTCTALLARDDLFGITWWCSHDLPTSLAAGFREPERHLGLFDSSGRPKPTAAAMANVASGGALPPTTTRKPSYVTVGRTDRNDFEHALRTHKLPVIVPDGRFHDTTYLRLRGVIH